MIRVSFDINPDCLASVTDSHLAALWHISQANPAPHGDRDAGELARAVSVEIVRRWLAQGQPELYTHQPGDHYWRTLMQHGCWSGPDDTWRPHGAAQATTTTPPHEAVQGGAS
jgi:hypothetical protein